MRTQGHNRVAKTNEGVPVGYKKTPLGILPEEWTTPKLSSILRENKCRNRDLSFGRESVLSVSGEKGVTNQIELLGRSFAGVSVADYRIVKHNDIVYTKSPLKANPYGIIKQNKGGPGIVSPLYAVYESPSETMSAYLDYWFSSDARLNNYLRPLVRRGPKNTLLIDDEEALLGTIAVPPGVEMERIVTILSSCDRVVENKQNLLNLMQIRKRALMRMLLEPNGGNAACNRVGGTQTNGRISHIVSGRTISALNEWEWKRLEEIATITSGSTPSRQHPEYWNGGIPWVTTGELATSPILKTVETISEVGREKASLRKYSKGTLLMAMYGQGKTRGTVSILGIDATINQACAAISTQSNDTMFLFYQLQYRYESIRRLSNVGSQENLNAEIIASISIPLPSLKTQRRIAAILAAADREIDGLAHEIDAWKEKRKALSQLLLSGKVRV